MGVECDVADEAVGDDSSRRRFGRRTKRAGRGSVRSPSWSRWGRRSGARFTAKASTCSASATRWNSPLARKDLKARA